MDNEQPLKVPGANRGQPTGKAQEETAPVKKMTGVGFYMVLAVVAINDVAGIISDISVIFFLVPIFSGIIAQGVTFLYLYWNGVKMADRKLAIILISTTIELIPFVNLLPAGTVNLIAIRTIENSDTAKKFAEKTQA